MRDGSFADQRRGTRQERGYGAQWDRKRLQILKRDNGLCKCEDCQAVGRLLEATEVDHLVNKAQWKLMHGSLAGVDGEDNLRAINTDCHKRKTAREAQAARQARRAAAGGG